MLSRKKMTVTVKTKRLVRGVLCTGLILLATAATAYAQESGDGSIYSRFGLGQRLAFPSSQMEAMGTLGIGLSSLNYATLSNPAGWSDQRLTRASVGAHYENLLARDAADNESRLTSGSLNGFHFSFPIRDDQLGIALAFVPYSRVNYRVQQQGEVEVDPDADETAVYRINYEGSGGLQQIVGGLGYRLSPRFSVGANANVIFGIVDQSRRTSFTSTSFSETNLTTSTRLFGVSGTVGVLFSVPGLLADEDELSVGALFTLPTTLRGDRVRTLGESLDRDTLGAKIEGNLDLPLQAGLGLSYRPDNRWLFVADGLYEPWSDFDSELSLPGFAPGEGTTFDDRLRVAAGFEYLPAGRNLLDSYFRRTAYRLGFYLDQAYASPLPDVRIRTLALTGGLSLPTLASGTRLDLGMEVGMRGTTDRNLVRDVFLKVSASVNIGERWFEKRKLR